MSYFTVNLLTPTNTVLDKAEADVLFVPTVKGEINLLPEHTHVVSKLDVGALTLKTSGGNKHFVIGGGVCKVLQKDVTILADFCEAKEDIDKDAAKANREAALTKLAGKDTLSDHEFAQAEYQFRLNDARLNLI